ncbi:hypothetical protein HK405_015656, partial [Cladochytrium tenue]
PKFSIWLNGSSDGTTLGAPLGGEMTVGGVDSTKFSGNLTWFPVASVPSSTGETSRFYWGADTDGLTLSYSDAPLETITVDPPSNNTIVIFDTGTTVMTVDSATYTDYLVPALNSLANATLGLSPVTSVFAGNGLQLLNCSLLTLLPNLTVALSDPTGGDGAPVPFALTPRDYVLYDGTGRCYLGIIALDLAGSPSSSTAISQAWVLGDVFLRRYFAAFDYAAGGRVGLAPSTGAATTFWPASATDPALETAWSSALAAAESSAAAATATSTRDSTASAAAKSTSAAGPGPRAGGWVVHFAALVVVA